MYAEDYVKQYHNITVPEFFSSDGAYNFYGTLATSTPVREYSNSKYTSRLGATYKERCDLKDLLLYNFLPKRAKDPKSGIEKVGSSYRLMSSWAPIDELPASHYQRAVGGKASPSVLRKFIQFFNYWRCYRVRVEGKEVKSIAYLVAQYLGADCNGFVGNYLAEEFPELDVNPNNPEESYLTKAKKKGGVIRKAIDEIDCDDIVVFHGHIGIISRVLTRAGKSANVVFCESRTRHQVYGGPQSNILELEQTSKGFKLQGREAVLDIVRIPGM
ncbi:MAG: hypothetical protein OHK0021_15130 [Bryobacter sp.]